MDITGLMVLPEDVAIVPVRELSPSVREKLDAPAESFAISRPRVRATSKILDPDATELLEAFRAPQRIVDAVMRFSRTHDLDPHETLEDALPLLEECIKARFLVPLDSPAAKSVQATLEPGDTLDDWEVVRLVRVLEDSELYRVAHPQRGDGALKILSSDAPGVAQAMLQREGAVLRHLDGVASPRLLRQGDWLGRPYLITEWRSGTSPEIVAAQRRGHRQALLNMCLRILDAYAELHARGVLHTDVHPGNVLIGEDDRVTILDFGLAWLSEDDVSNPRSPRGGVGFFFEPEYAAAALAGVSPRPPTPAGEQYRIAALLYFLLTGDHYLEFSLESDESLRQIVRDQPLPFWRRGAQPWPEVEATLATALSKKAEDRYASVPELAAALRRGEGKGDADHRESGESDVPDGMRPASLRLLDSVLQRVDVSAPLYEAGPDEGPRCSVYYGRAGIAYALYRVASARNDPALLALADSWITSALQRMQNDKAFSDPRMDLTEERIGSVSPYHTASGVYCVAALIQQARSDTSMLDETLAAFVAASRRPSDHLDLTLGQAGTLLACSLLLDALPERGRPATTAVFDLGSDTLAALWSALNDCERIPQCSRIHYAGMAHGWAGFLYATLRWCRTSGTEIPRSVRPRLDELAECAEPAGRGMRWPWMVSGDKSKLPAESMAGWCNGSAGYVFLWTMAYRATGHDRYLALAEGAAWDAWDAVRTPSDLCCGVAGRAYALINFFKETGDKSWLARARELAEAAAAAAAPSRFANSLYKGQPGIAVLAADLGRTDLSGMPFFEEEGWPSPEELQAS